MYTVNDIADWFLGKDSMSPKKLQKLVYYAYAWVLTLMNENEDDLDVKLFDSRLEAWIHGPLFPELYHKYKGESIIPQKSSVPRFDEDMEDIMEQVWQAISLKALHIKNLRGLRREGIVIQQRYVLTKSLIRVFIGAI